MSETLKSFTKNVCVFNRDLNIKFKYDTSSTKGTNM